MLIELILPYKANKRVCTTSDLFSIYGVLGQTNQLHTLSLNGPCITSLMPKTSSSFSFHHSNKPKLPFAHLKNKLSRLSKLSLIFTSAFNLHPQCIFRSLTHHCLPIFEQWDSTETLIHCIECNNKLVI